jgi:hypothetical protein
MELSASLARDLLVETGRSVQIAGADELIVDNRPFSVRLRNRPTPSDLRREFVRHSQRRPDRGLMYVVSRVSPALNAAARELPSVTLLGIDDRVMIAAGQALPISDHVAPGTPTTATRQPWGRFAVMRALVLLPARPRQTELAAATGISQAAVSKALRALGPVAAEARAGSRHAAQTLWRDFMMEYPGPRGITTNWYSLDPPTRQAEIVQARYPNTLLSGDAGADLLAPWRVVRRAIVYTRVGSDLADLGFAEADAADATLAVAVPADHTVFATAGAWNAAQGGTPVADPLMMAHDVRSIGGPDAEEAIEKIKERVLTLWH